MPHQHEQDLHEYGDPWHEKSDWLHRVRNAVISRQPLATLPKVLSFETSLLKVPTTQWLDLLRYARRKWLLYHRLQPDDVRGWKPRWAKQIPRARATCKHWGGRAASEKSKLLFKQQPGSKRRAKWWPIWLRDQRWRLWGVCWISQYSKGLCTK